MQSLLISFAATLVCTPLVILLARRMGWVAAPRADRWHQRPTALMGGIGIFAGALCGWILSGGQLQVIAPLSVAGLAMFVLGFIDDRIQLRPHVKLLGQIAAGALLMSMGVRFEWLPPILSLPLTLFWLLAITNAVNLLDNMDGLAAGVCAVAAGVVGIYAGEGQPGAQAAFGLAGACLGFLVFNFNPARIFMGDCGSLFLGFSLAAVSIQGAHRSAPSLALALFAPVAMLAVPIFDTTLVSVVRTLNGRAISQGGRDHSSHRLVALGLSERVTVLVLWGITAAFGGLALASLHMRFLVVALMAALLFLALAGLGVFLGFLKVYQVEGEAPEQLRVIGGRLQYTRQRLQMVLDLVFIPIAFLAAHLLRFEGDPEPAVIDRIVTVMPMIIVAKLAALWLCRSYRGVWRSAGLADAIRAIAGSTLGSVVAALVLALGPGFKDLSRAALVMDWGIFTMLAVAARLGYVLLREAFSMLPSSQGPRVLILGGGDEVLSIARRLRDPLAPQRAVVVGILDDDASRHGRALNGVPVIGSLEDLPAAMEREDVHRCVLGVSEHSPAGRRIRRFCTERNIPLYMDLETLLPAQVEAGSSRTYGAPHRAEA